MPGAGCLGHRRPSLILQHAPAGDARSSATAPAHTDAGAVQPGRA
jgi:hypothetical protein